MSDLSWLNPTPHAIAVYASRPLSPGVTQHSLPSGRYPLLGPDFHRLDRTSLRLAHSLDHLVARASSPWREDGFERLRCLEGDCSRASEPRGLWNRLPFARRIIEVARHLFTIPLVLQVALLLGYSHDVGPKNSDALTSLMTDTGIVEAIAAIFPQFSA